MKTYTIEIDDDQRKLLVDACRLFLRESVSEDGALDLLDLLGMLQELPEIEKNDPGIIHGLCW